MTAAEGIRVELNELGDERHGPMGLLLLFFFLERSILTLELNSHPQVHGANASTVEISNLANGLKGLCALRFVTD